jgi:hypothetical protein
VEEHLHDLPRLPEAGAPALTTDQCGYLFNLICDLSPTRLVEVAGGLLSLAAVHGIMV